MLDEFEIMNMLHHPNIQKAHRLIIDDKELPPSILLEYFPLNLEEVMKKNVIQSSTSVFNLSNCKSNEIHSFTKNRSSKFEFHQTFTFQKIESSKSEDLKTHK